MTIANYFLIKVNVFFVSLIGSELKILVIKRVNSSFWELPSKYLQKNEELTFACERAAKQIIYDSKIVNYHFAHMEPNMSGEEIDIDLYEVLKALTEEDAEDQEAEENEKLKSEIQESLPRIMHDQ